MTELQEIKKALSSSGVLVIMHQKENGYLRYIDFYKLKHHLSKEELDDVEYTLNIGSILFFNKDGKFIGQGTGDELPRFIKRTLNYDDLH